MSDMDFSKACDALVEIIQQGDSYKESYSLMLMTFTDAKCEEETNRMALSLAKDAIALPAKMGGE